MEEEILKKLEGIEYGFKDKNNFNIINDLTKWDKEFSNFYYLMSPEEVLEKQCGTCFDLVELERKLFKDLNIPVKTYFICTYDSIDNLPSHSFLTYKKNNKVYWFEYSWYDYRGIHEYSNELELLKDVKNKFIKSHNTRKDAYTFIYKFKKPQYHLTCDEYYQYCEKGKLMKVNEPLYFYHVVSKNANLEEGLLSLQYMYDHKMFKEFDKYTSKYLRRIVNDWQIDKYKNRQENSLTREEILDALNIFRGNFGSEYIYFFRYPPYRELGVKIANLLEAKDIYRININDEEVEKTIKDIFYGYENSNSDNLLLDKEYYETVTEREYFKNYDDNKEMNFASLNHIGIAFINNYCPIKFLQKVNEKNDK